jgi:hypothetical protein
MIMKPQTVVPQQPPWKQTTTCRLYRLLGLAAAVALAATLPGCGGGGGKGDLSGKVQLIESGRTRTVVYGDITVVASDGSTHHCEIDETGSYSLSDIPAGEAKVTVMAVDPKVAAIAQGRIRSREGQKGGGRKVDPSKFIPIPQKYQNAGTTDLTVTIAKGSNTYDIQMKKE